MSSIELDDLHQLGHAIADFGAKADFRLGTPAVLLYRFSDIGTFTHAKREIMRAMTPALLMGGPTVENDGHTLSFDIYGITIKLICPVRFATPSGPVGAAEAKVVYRRDLKDEG